jgi:hypothetical protein
MLSRHEEHLSGTLQRFAVILFFWRLNPFTPHPKKSDLVNASSVIKIGFGFRGHHSKGISVYMLLKSNGKEATVNRALDGSTYPG